MREYNLKNIKQDFKEKGIFYTPPELALFLKSLLPDDVKEIYDPTCGNGSLLSVFDDNVIKYGQDINAEQVEIAMGRLKNFNGVVGDTLKNPAFLDKKFDAIVANYPFSIKWNPIKDERFANVPDIPTQSKADYAFILHIIYYLSNVGKAATLNFPGILYRGGREGIIRKWLVENNYIEKIISIEGNKFTDTKIATVAIVFNKSKKDNNIVFVQGDIEKSVSLKEIEENNFILSPNCYIEEKTEEIQIDPIKLEMDIRKVTINNLRRTLEISKLVDNFEDGKMNFQALLDDIKTVVKEFE